ncbi:unnamed protein product [Vicia faba]|uniref:Uncharacterized protein n=1 Tax=Vicia faba TaxID=3906 RepID=A0AAV0Z1N0_VICFA|nr:unnamed protein product [Vicia faba]
MSNIDDRPALIKEDWQCNEEEIVEILRENVDLFACKLSDMYGTDPSFMCHHLALDPDTKPISQKKQKGGEEKRKIVKEEVGKLLNAGFIKEIK